MGLVVTMGLPVVVLVFLVMVLFSVQIKILDGDTLLANCFRERGAALVVLGGYMGLLVLGQSVGTLFVVPSLQMVMLHCALGLEVIVGLPVVVLVCLVKVLFSALIRIFGDDASLASRFTEQGAVHHWAASWASSCWGSWWTRSLWCSLSGSTAPRAWW